MTDKVNFVASTHQGVVTVQRSKGNFRISMTPAEADKATHLIGLVLQTLQLKTVPDHLNYTPFTVRLFENKKFALERTDQSGSLPFRSFEGDELIQVIGSGVGMALNERANGRVIPSSVGSFGGLLVDESF